MFNHHPVNEPCVDQIVRLDGTTDGRTEISIENGEADQPGLAPTSAYWLDPSKLTAAFVSDTNPGTPRCPPFT